VLHFTSLKLFIY